MNKKMLRSGKWSDKKPLLETLPSFGKEPCKDCGAPDWSSCNEHPDGGFYQCNKCHVYDEKKGKLVRRSLQ